MKKDVVRRTEEILRLEEEENVLRLWVDFSRSGMLFLSNDDIREGVSISLCLADIRNLKDKLIELENEIVKTLDKL